jgi:hypothetical protein|tara:strand:+ start:1281 stop:1457 length:177 start_codon:yes stop_codon:yes gene_type:complete
MRDNKVIDTFLAKEKDKKKDMELFKVLKKEVNVGANGTQSYIIKEGINKGKLIEKKDG